MSNLHGLVLTIFIPLLLAFVWWKPFFTGLENGRTGAAFTYPRPGWYHHESFINSNGPPYSGKTESDDPWNIHHYLGGNGPWNSRENATQNSIVPPHGCKVDQVHLLSRHSERYPTRRVGVRLLTLLQALQQPEVSLSGPLEFVKDWKFFTSIPGRDFDQLTRTGPYAGTLGAFTTGVKMKSRYGHLLDTHFQSKEKLNMWAGDSVRVIETAEHFAAGFLGLDWQSRASLHVIPEDLTTGANTLTPGKACPKFQQDLVHGREGGYLALKQFTDATFDQTAVQLQRHISTNQSSTFTLSPVDVYAMQELCGFEISTRGHSPWCDVFTKEEWERFAYARDVLHFYRTGPGSHYSDVMGHLYLNATAQLMMQGPDAGQLFFSFVHDGDIIPVLTALRILHDREPLPTTHMKQNRSWKMSSVTPMGGRIILERLSCLEEPQSEGTAEFIRININDGIVPVPGCDSGSGLCALDKFVARLQEHAEEAGDFREVCGLADDMADRITFLRQ